MFFMAKVEVMCLESFQNHATFYQVGLGSKHRWVVGDKHPGMYGTLRDLKQEFFNIKS
jgi:hypothetical protein